MTEHSDIVPGVAQPPRREQYIPIVRAMRPFMSEDEITLRASLMLMRDRAMATKNQACAPAWALLDVVERVASESAMNHKLGLDELRELRRICLNTVASASSFDTLFHPRLPLSDPPTSEAA